MSLQVQFVNIPLPELKAMAIDWIAEGVKLGRQQYEAEQRKSDDPEELVSVEDVALALNRNIRTVQRHIAAKKIATAAYPANKKQLAIKRKYISELKTSIK